MTSFKQIKANRRNAHKSTGPRSEEGKQRSSRNAIRHGLTAETVIQPLEDSEDYQLFEEAIAAEYDAESAVERELVLRLASLLWRLRRATSIETTLFGLAAELPTDRSDAKPIKPRATSLPSLLRLPVKGTYVPCDKDSENAALASCQNDASHEMRETESKIAIRFLRLAKLDNGAFDRLNRYELALWRQTRQTLFMLEAVRWRTSRAPAYARPNFWQRREDFSEG